MATASNVTVGKPLVGGAIYRAAVGSTLPTTADETLDTAFKSLGYISEDGLSNTNSFESDIINAWGGDPVLSTQGKKTDTFTFTLLEVLNDEVLKTVYGDDNVTGTISTGISVKANNALIKASAFVVDMICSNGSLRRIVIPEAKLTEIGEITYKDDEAVGYEITILALPDTNGNNHYEYVKSN